MSDDNEQIVIDDIIETTPEEPVLPDEGNISTPDVPKKEEVQISDKPKGYQSYDEWTRAGKDPDEFKGSKAYAKEGERYEALIRTQREVKEVKDLAAKLWEQNQKIEEAAYKRAKEELKLESMNAARIGDVEAVNTITDRLIELESTKPQVVKSVEKPVVPDSVSRFLAKNSWYTNPRTEEDHIKAAFIKFQDERGIPDHYAEKGITLSVDQHMEVLQQRIDEKFNTKAVKVSIVPETGGDIGKSPSETRTLMNKLSPEDRKIVQMLQKSSGMTTQQLKDYVRRAELIRGVK